MQVKKFAVSDALTGSEIKDIRRKLTLTQAEFANLTNVSVKTIERWEGSQKEITGPIVTLLKILKEYPELANRLEVPEKIYPLRLWYMYRNEVCTVIDVDERNRKVRICNYTENPLFRAFGRNETPNYIEYEDFLESRCFPKSRDKMKLVLRDVDLPFYDPFLIIEKTQGRMAEDNFWIKIER